MNNATINKLLAALFEIERMSRDASIHSVLDAKQLLRQIHARARKATNLDIAP